MGQRADGRWLDQVGAVGQWAQGKPTFPLKGERGHSNFESMTLTMRSDVGVSQRQRTKG
jgi:hypothetical protein